MKLSPKPIRIGLRTIKTAVAVMVSMMVVTLYGSTTSRLIFALLGAMDGVQPSVKDSLRAAKTQIVGVLCGALLGLGLRELNLYPVLTCGLGVVLVITIYNALQVPFAPSLACLILVSACTTPEVHPIPSALGRIWDTAIGLGIGTAINALVFPYDNRQLLRQNIHQLEQEVIDFLSELFDGDDVMPDVAKMEEKIADMAKQLTIFSNQRLMLRRHQRLERKQELEVYRQCQSKARELLAQMEVLTHMEPPGRLSKENWRKLRSCGAQISHQKPSGSMKERDLVTNYHVSHILKLRSELLKVLKE